MFQSAAFATGLPPDLYAFHRYTGNSALLSHPLAWQYPLRFPGWARSFNRRLTKPPTHPVRPVNPNNACHLRITAAAGTKLAVAASGGTVRTIARSIFPPERGLQSGDLHPPRGVAASGFRPLRNIPYCCLPWESGPCRSASVADRPLRPATRQSLGRPLPYQQADRT